MENLLSSRCQVLQYVPESYVLPPQSRPGNILVPLFHTIPTFDLALDPTELVPPIIKACQDFGFFQVMNSGVCEKVMQEALSVADEFFMEVGGEEKASLYSEDSTKKCRLYTSIDYSCEKLHYWRDALVHHCHPLQHHSPLWPNHPARYREVIGKYSVVVRELSLRLLRLISEGLGLGLEYFEQNQLNEVQLISLTNYPPCPDPSLALGLPKHTDPNLITLISQGNVNGLQVFHDEQWFAVHPLPAAFLVNVGQALQVISNGKLKSVEHRVVTSQSVGRKTIVSTIHPAKHAQIQPAEELVHKFGRSIYTSFSYADYLSTSKVDRRDGKSPLERYQL